MRVVARIFAAALLTAGLACVMPPVAASASAGVTVTWIDAYGATDTFTYACSGTQTYYGEDIVDITNGCGYRVWAHQYTDGSGASYCVNPGALAYGFTADFEQILVSENGAACDAGAESTVGWGNAINYNTVEDVTQASCVDGATYTDYLFSSTGSSYLGVEDLPDACNTRIWIHENSDGSGDAFCVSPGESVNSLSPPYGNWANEYGLGEQIQVTANQAPCSAG
jgi:hypothetical protein